MSLEQFLRALVREEVAAALSAFAPAKPAKTKAAAPAAPAPESAPPAATPAPTVATAPAPVQPAQSPAAPTLSKEKLNKAVLAVASTNREAAVAILAKFGVVNTATLPVEQYQAVFDAFEEKLAQLQAASVQASLV